jgi:hypothetical protein
VLWRVRLWDRASLAFLTNATRAVIFQSELHDRIKMQLGLLLKQAAETVAYYRNWIHAAVSILMNSPIDDLLRIRA